MTMFLSCDATKQLHVSHTWPLSLRDCSVTHSTSPVSKPLPTPLPGQCMTHTENNPGLRTGDCLTY